MLLEHLLQLPLVRQALHFLLPLRQDVFSLELGERHQPTRHEAISIAGPQGGMTPCHSLCPVGLVDELAFQWVWVRGIHLVFFTFGVVCIRLALAVMTYIRAETERVSQFVLWSD